MLNKTRNVLEKIANEPFFKNNDIRFVGGTALSYLINHRLSEDLDFAMLSKLPSNDIKQMMQAYGAKSIDHDDYMRDRAINEGMDIEDYHIRFLLDGVKIEFFSPPFNLLEKEIWENEEVSSYLNSHIKIASLKTIMYMKSMAFWNRKKYRDLFDIYYAIKNDYYSVYDFLELYKKYNITYNTKMLLERIQAKNEFYQKYDDEGLFGLVEEAKTYEWYRNEIEKFIYSKYLAEIYH